MNVFRGATLVAEKDLRIEFRSRVLTSQVMPFGAIVVLLFAFALDPDRGVLRRVAPGLFWISALFIALLVISRAFALEQRDGVLNTLRLSTLDSASVYLGKMVAVVIQLVVLELVMGTAVVLLYNVPLRSIPALLAMGLAATLGIAAAGCLYGALLLHEHSRESLLPLLLLPVLAPVMLGATRAYENALAGSPGESMSWLVLVSLFALLYTALGVLCFGTLLEER